MLIPQSFLSEIRNRLSVSAVIGKRIKVTRAGREYKACCPFHREKTPSFTINDDKQFYHCFGCGAHGDVLKFVMEHDGLPFMDAVKALAAEAGLQMPKLDPLAVREAEEAKDLYAMMDEAASWMSAQLGNNAHRAVLDYVQNRGLDAQARRVFRIGYAPADGQALRTHLRKAGYTDEDMLKAGLLKKSGKPGGAPYVFFRERVMFPVMDRRGRVLAFGGRVLPESLRAPAQGGFTPPKYINSAETPLFDKGRTLYGETTARPAVRDGHTLIVTEGYMDVIACHSAGFKATVAPMGTALTEEQILALWSMQNRECEESRDPVLCFDGDEAGRRAAARACENILPLLGAGKSVRFAFLPEGEDPDSLLRGAGPKAFRQILQSALSLFEFLWSAHTAGRRFDTPESRAALNKALQQEIARIQDAEVQRHYREILRNRISETFFRPFDRKKTSALRTPGMKPRAPLSHKTQLAEKILIAAILNNPALYTEIDERFGSLHIENKSRDRLRQSALYALEENPGLESEDLHHILKTQGFEKEMDDILRESVYVHAAFSRPGALEKLGTDEVLSGWIFFYDGLHEGCLKQEVRQGWKEAMMEADRGREEQLALLQRKKLGTE